MKIFYVYCWYALGHIAGLYDKGKPLPLYAKLLLNCWLIDYWFFTTIDDERDLLYFLVRQKNGKWIALSNVDIMQARLDLLQFDLSEPYEKWVLHENFQLRVKTELLEKWFHTSFSTSDKYWLWIWTNCYPFRQLYRFVILRTRINVGDKAAQAMALSIETQIVKKSVTVVLRQR